MAKVWFRCDRKNVNIFVLNTLKDLDYIPLIGDIINFRNDDFQNSTFRVKPYGKKSNDHHPPLENYIGLSFKVKSRKLTFGTYQEWELICEPTVKSLITCLKSIKSK